MKRFFFFLFLLLFSLSTLALSPNDLERDALYFWEMIEEVHPHLYHTTSKDEVEEFMATWRAKIQREEEYTLLSAYRELAQIAALFRDGHTSIFFPQEEWRTYLSSGGGILPLRVRLKENSLWIQDPFEEERFPEGTQLLSINGVETETLLETMLSRISYESKVFGIHRLNQSFHQYLWAFFGIEGPFTIKVRGPDDKKEILLLEGIEIESLPVREDRDPYRLLSLTPCTGLLVIDSVPRERNEEYFLFLEESFREIKKRDKRHLIIDMRHNGGGSTHQYNEIFHYISQTPYRTFSYIEMNYSKPYLDTLSCPLRIYYGIRNLLKGHGRVTREPELYTPPANDLLFQGQVYLLVGPGTFSAAADFAALCQDFKAAMIVGEETGGWPTSYGDSFYFTLPETGLLARSSYKFFVRPSGDRSRQGVIPDWEMEIGDEYRELLERIELEGE